MPFEPTLPTPIRKHFIIEDESQLIVLGKLSGAVKEFCLNDKPVENVNQYHSPIMNKHVAIITYLE